METMPSSATSPHFLPRTLVRVLFITACFTSIFSAPASVAVVSAQEGEIGLDNLAAEVWPEYDQPSVLVILNGTVNSDTTLPVQVRVPVPLGVELNAVAYTGEDGRLISIPSTTELALEGQDVVFTLEQPDFVVEYYADIISPPPNRSFELDLTAPYSVGQASVTLRQPARASNLTTTPALQPTGTDSLGNPLYSAQLGPMAAGQTIPLSVSYTKADANPTIANAVVGDDAATGVASTSATSEWLPLGIGLVLGLAVVVVVAVLLLRRNRASGGSRQSRRRAAREKGTLVPRSSVSTGSAKTPQNLFCPQCGTKYEATDQFCRNCGEARH